MINKLGRILAAIVLVASLGAVTTGSALAEGSCLSPTVQQDKIAAMKQISGVTNFDAVQGAATTQDLDNCYGGGGSAILPANIQTNSWIYQLGYQDYSTGFRCFVYAFETTAAHCVGGGPTVGRSYLYTITLADLPNGTMNVHYTIVDKTASPDVTVVDFTKNSSAVQFGWLTWWGAERQETQSSLGDDHNGPDINVRLMKYSFNGDGGAWIQRTGLSASNMCNNNNAAPGCDFVRTTAMQTESATQHFHIGTDNYTNDQVNFDNTAS